MIKITVDDLRGLIIPAVRYALGRHTYVVSWVCGIVENHAEKLHENDWKVMVEDIDRQEKHSLGDDWDRADWLKLKKFLLILINEKEKQ